MTIYRVTREGAPDDERPYLVETKHEKDAIAHVASGAFKAEAISTADAMAHAADGVKLHTIAPKERKPREKKA